MNDCELKNMTNILKDRIQKGEDKAIKLQLNDLKSISKLDFYNTETDELINTIKF